MASASIVALVSMSENSFDQNKSHSGLTALPPCIMCVQYIGGCSVHRGHTMNTLGGYHEYTGILSTSGIS